MTRERNKPDKSWLEKTREELANPEKFAVKRAYEVGKIRGRKEIIDKACDWLMQYFVFDHGRNLFLRQFRKAMEE